MDFPIYIIGPIIFACFLAFAITCIVCSCCKSCPLHKWNRRHRIEQMQMWQEDMRAAGMDPSQMHQYGHKHGQAPIFFTNQPPVQLHQGQTAYPGQPFQGPPGYSGQLFPQGQTSVHSNNLPSATMWNRGIFTFDNSWIMICFLEEAMKIRPAELTKRCMSWPWIILRYRSI